MGLAVGTFPRPGGGRCLVYYPPPLPPLPPSGRLFPVPWKQTPIGGGYAVVWRAHGGEGIVEKRRVCVWDSYEAR